MPRDHETSSASSSSGSANQRAATRPSAAGSSPRATTVADATGSGCSRTTTSVIDAERSQRAGEELGQVVSGDVLDHRAARPGDRAVGERGGHPEEQIPRRAVAMAQRARVGRRDHSADGCASVGRIEREHLPGLGEHRLRVGQPNAGAEHRGQVARVVLESGRTPAVESTTSGSGVAAPQLHFVPPPRGRTEPPAASSSAASAAVAGVSTLTSAPRARPPRRDAAGTARAPRRTGAGSA